jgi:hypothetical protein
MTCCADCKTIGFTQSVPACSDYHLYGQTLCSKEVCRSSCRFVCINCQTLNRVHLHDALDFFYDAFSCYSCQKENQVTLPFNGNFRQACTQYCAKKCLAACGPIVIEGRPDTRVQEQFVVSHYTDDLHTWLKEHFKFIYTATDLNIHDMLDRLKRKESIQSATFEKPLYIIYEAVVNFNSSDFYMPCQIAIID